VAVIAAFWLAGQAGVAQNEAGGLVIAIIFMAIVAGMAWVWRQFTTK
jgi:hypothetical protein